MRADVAEAQPLAFLDTSTLLTLLGCPNLLTVEDLQRAARGRPLALHQAHYDEAARRLSQAVLELVNTGRNGGQCLENLARQVLQRLRPETRPRSLRDLGRLVIRARMEAQRLLRSLTRRKCIPILDDTLEPTSTLETPQCRSLSPEDKLLVQLAIECHTIITGDNQVVDCCRTATHEPAKCVKTPEKTAQT